MEECFLDFDFEMTNSTNCNEGEEMLSLSEPTEVTVDFESEDVRDCEWELEPSPKAAGTSSSAMANTTLPIWSPDEDTGMCNIKKDAKYKCTLIYYAIIYPCRDHTYSVYSTIIFNCCQLERHGYIRLYYCL